MSWLRFPNARSSVLPASVAGVAFLGASRGSKIYVVLFSRNIVLSSRNDDVSAVKALFAMCTNFHEVGFLSFFSNTVNVNLSSSASDFCAFNIGFPSRGCRFLR